MAEGFPWQPGDNVVLPANEFPSNQYLLDAPGRSRRRNPSCAPRSRPGPPGSPGRRLRRPHPHRGRQLGRLLQRLAARPGPTRRNGPLRGALLFLDAIQGLGVFPLDVAKTPVDFLAADGHKWLLGPEGAGVFFLRREHLDMLRPLGLGWHSVVHQSDFNRIELTLKSTAARYEGGSANVPGLLALGASVELLAGFGTEAISRRVLETTERACSRLESIGAVVAQRPLVGTRQRDRRLRVARPRSEGRPQSLPQSRRRAQLPRRSPADQSPRLQQRRRR